MAVVSVVYKAGALELTNKVSTVKTKSSQKAGSSR